MSVFVVQEAARLRPVITAVWDAVKNAIHGGPVEVEIRRPSKSREQEKKYHAMIQDIARQAELDGRQFGLEVWKAWAVDEFEQALQDNGEQLRHPSEVVLSRDKRRAVTIRASTRKFRKHEGSLFIEFLYKLGTDLNVKFSDKSMDYYEEMLRSRGELPPVNDQWMAD